MIAEPIEYRELVKIGAYAKNRLIDSPSAASLRGDSLSLFVVAKNGKASVFETPVCKDAAQSEYIHS